MWQKRLSTSSENIQFDEMTNMHYQRKGSKFLLKRSKPQYRRNLRQNLEYRNAEQESERMQKREGKHKEFRNTEQQCELTRKQAQRTDKKLEKWRKVAERNQGSN